MRIKTMEDKELKERFIDEKTGIEYIRKSDYYYPNLVDTASVNPNELGEYGKLRLKYLLANRSYERYNNEKQKHLQFKGSISYLIFQYEKLLGIDIEIVSKPNITKMTPELIQAIKRMDEFSKQVRFLAKNNINTEQELLNYQKLAYEKINPLKSERENLWRKHKRAKTEDEKETTENKIVEVSKKITPLAEEIRHCDSIFKRLEKIKEFELHQKLEEERKQFVKEQKREKYH